MSQSCDAIQLVVIDANCLHEEAVSSTIWSVINAGMRLGVISDDPDSIRQVNSSPHANAFDFWLPGDNGAFPVTRVTALTDITPGRVLFVSTRSGALSQAEDAGFRTADPTSIDTATLLP